MEIKTVLHNISKLKWLFSAIQIGLIVYAFFSLQDNFILIVSYIIFITGIQMGLDSLSDIEKMSPKEISYFKKENHIKNKGKLLYVSIITLVIISTLFMSLKFIFRSNITFNAFFDLGLNCWALILGMLCLLKSLYEKNEFVNGKI